MTASENTGSTGTDATSSGPGRANGVGRGRAVVGIDRTDRSREALRWALRYAALADLEVDAVAVWHQALELADYAPVLTPEQFEAEARRWLSDAVAMTDLADRARLSSARAENGDPAQVLVEHAKGAELLVLGNHGRGALSSAVLGSVAQSCTHHARCPVVLVPEERTEDDPATDEDSQDEPPAPAG